MVKGDEAALQQVVRMAGQLFSAAAAAGRIAVQVEALAFQALAFTQRGQRAKGLKALEQGLRLAEGEGYRRLFVDLGLPMARLLQEAQARRVMPDYTTALLEPFGRAIAPGTSSPAALPEPLTEREKEVLKLMAAGLTNQEIGEELVISPGTVKKHASNIYGKLGVGGRTEAAARARALNLLD
jgi:LuxR family maltose regulon positive regulatory protein